MNILKIPECDCCLGEESVSACTYLATNMRRMNKTWLPVLIFYVSITCGCYEGHVLSVVVHVGGHVSVLLDCVYLSRIHAQPHCWANMHVVTAAVTSTGLRQRHLLGLKMHWAGYQQLQRSNLQVWDSARCSDFLNIYSKVYYKHLFQIFF